MRPEIKDLPNTISFKDVQYPKLFIVEAIHLLCHNRVNWNTQYTITPPIIINQIHCQCHSLFIYSVMLALLLIYSIHTTSFSVKSSSNLLISHTIHQRADHLDQQNPTLHNTKMRLWSSFFSIHTIERLNINITSYVQLTITLNTTFIPRILLSSQFNPPRIPSPYSSHFRNFRLRL